MKTCIIIPARLNSTRFPRKILKKINGKSMLRHCCESAIKSEVGDVFVAVDSEEAKNEVIDLVEVIETGNCKSGTERVLRAFQHIRKNGYDFVLNLQADMPFVSKEIIEGCRKILQYYDISTVINEHTFTVDPEKIKNKNHVKAIVTRNLKVQEKNTFTCHWFTRYPIEYAYHHLGIYGFKQEILEELSHILFQQKESEICKLEKLEQIQFIENGFSMGSYKVNEFIIEINHPEDLNSIII